MHTQTPRITCFLLPQSDNTPIDYANDEDVKAAFAEHFAQVVITDDNKNGLLFLFVQHASPVYASRLPAILQAGADLALTDKVCARVIDERDG
jgi:hypothetical protein